MTIRTRTPLPLVALAIVWPSLQPAEAACTRWQADVTWSHDQGEDTHTGTGADRQSALANVRAACSKAGSATRVPAAETGATFA